MQLHGWRRAEDLAEHFEVSKRTIYRDIDALGEAGVPVIASPGQGFRLGDGYFLPPLAFTVTEAAMLVLGANAIAPQFDDEYARAAASAIEKLRSVLPTERQEALNAVRESITFVDALHEAYHDTLSRLRRGILERQRVHFRYRTGRATESARTVDPYLLLRIDRSWLLAGHCHLRNDLRYFRLDRMAGLEVLAEQFRRPELDAIAWQERDDRTHRAMVFIELRSVHMAREQPSYFQTSSEHTENGDLIHLSMRRDEDILPWLLSFGASARVISPPSLIALHRSISQQMAGMYDAVAIPVSQPPGILDER